jgi:hypothetical protein
VLFDANGVPVPTGIPVTYTNPTPADQEIFLLVPQGPPCAPYGLEITSVGTCTPDGFEPNDTAAQSPALSPGLNVLTLDDDDWFSFELQEGHRLSVNARFQTPPPGFVEIIDSGFTLDFGQDYVGYTNPLNSGLLQGNVLVTPANPNACVPYTLDVLDIDCSSTDMNEPNESIADATPVPPPNQQRFITTQADQDYYRFVVPPGQSREAVVRFRHGDGDIDIRLYDVAGNQLDSSVSVNDDETVAWTNSNQGAQTVFLRVYLFGSPAVDCARPYTVQVF